MSKIPLALLGIPVAAYLLGSIPFGLLLTGLFGGVDVRKSGSGNIGATNVARVAGPLAGILTLLFDAGKGAAAVWLAGRVSNESATWMTIAGLAALLGHCFPIWLKFRGGKGVATAAGAFFWRYVSLASISAAAAMPLLIYFLWAPHHAPPPVVTFGALAAAAVIIYKHDGNIQRLVQGEESKCSFGKKRDAA